MTAGLARALGGVAGLIQPMPPPDNRISTGGADRINWRSPSAPLIYEASLGSWARDPHRKMRQVVYAGGSVQ